MPIKQTTQLDGCFVSLNKDFIHSWTMPEYICDEILDYYKNNIHLHHKGIVQSTNKKIVKNDCKISTDLSIEPNNNDRPFGDYRNELQNCLNMS